MSPRDEYLELITARHGDNHDAINNNLRHFDACDTYAQSVLILIEHGRNAITNRWRTGNALRTPVMKYNRNATQNRGES